MTNEQPKEIIDFRDWAKQQRIPRIEAKTGEFVLTQLIKRKITPSYYYSGDSAVCFEFEGKGGSYFLEVNCFGQLYCIFSAENIEDTTFSIYNTKQDIIKGINKIPKPQ